MAPHRIVLRKAHKRLMEDFHVESEIDKLIQHDVITRETWEEIKTQKSRKNQLRMFLLKLGSYDATKFTAFLEVLKESHIHLVEELNHWLNDETEGDMDLFEDDRMQMTCVRCQICKRVQPEEVIDELFSRGIIGATALRKYMDPNSGFRGSCVWKYVFENLTILQRNKVDVSEMMGEILSKNYMDLARRLRQRGEWEWDCTCVLHEELAPMRVHSISNASSEITRKYGDLTSRPTTPEPLSNVHMKSRSLERKLFQVTSENKILPNVHKNPDIVVTLENDIIGEETETGILDPDIFNRSPFLEEVDDGKQLLKPPADPARHGHHVPDMTYKNPCFNDALSPADGCVPNARKTRAPSKKNIWEKFFPNTQEKNETGV